MGAEVAVQTDAPPVAGEREVVLRTERLTKRYGKRLAVSGLNLEVRRGDVYGLLGPNGAGKSTTLRMVLGLIWPTNGVISLFGERASDGGARQGALRRVGAVVEQPAFYPYLSGRDNLLGCATFAGLPVNATTRARIEETLVQVGLASRAKDLYKKYSLGMKQRLGIAAALLTNPELVVLDEPTNGLDPAGMVEVRSLVSQLAQRGTTVLLSSHLLHEVQQVCTRVGILKEGVLIGQGEVAQLLASQIGIQLGFDSPETAMKAASALAQATTEKAPWIRGMQWIQPEPGTWTPPGGWMLLVDAPGIHAAEINALLAEQNIHAAELRHREGNLEQFFLALTGAADIAALVPAPPIAAGVAAQTLQQQGGQS